MVALFGSIRLESFFVVIYLVVAVQQVVKLIIIELQFQQLVFLLKLVLQNFQLVLVSSAHVVHVLIVLQVLEVLDFLLDFDRALVVLVVKSPPHLVVEKVHFLLVRVLEGVVPVEVVAELPLHYGVPALQVLLYAQQLLHERPLLEDVLRAVVAENFAVVDAGALHGEVAFLALPLLLVHLQRLDFVQHPQLPADEGQLRPAHRQLTAVALVVELLELAATVVIGYDLHSVAHGNYLVGLRVVFFGFLLSAALLALLVLAQQVPVSVDGQKPDFDWRCFHLLNKYKK